MTATDLLTLLPLISLAVTILVVMLTIAFRRDHRITVLLTAAGLAFSLLATFIEPSAGRGEVMSLLTGDAFAILYTRLLLAATLLIVPFAYTYFQRRNGHKEEFYLLMLLATLGATVLAWSIHFVALFLGLELLSVALYGLAAYSREREQSIEAGLKYLVLAAVSAAFLLFGMALIYANQGSMSLSAIAASSTMSLLQLTGLGLIVVGVGFKLGVVPFHMWIADVYDGAPAPAGAFIATVSKGAVLALLLRLFSPAHVHDQPALLLTFGLIAVGSILVGNLLAMQQTNLKRILAYSSVAHLGYLLVAFLAGGDRATVAATFYAVAYIVTILAAFGIISLMSNAEGDADQLEHYRGLFWKRPILAGVLTVAMFSLAGLPLTGGFIGKFFILDVGIHATLWAPALILVLGSVLGLFYYLRVIVMMYSAPVETDLSGQVSIAPFTAQLTLVVLVLLLIGFGIYPNALITLIQNAVGGLI
jgi:NADH-quinone oxidoreductase subunit N